MSKHGFLYHAFHLYYDGFRSMTLGRTLWLVIGVKLFIIFIVLKLLFFPNHISDNATEGHEADYVAGQLLRQAEQKP